MNHSLTDKPVVLVFWLKHEQCGSTHHGVGIAHFVLPYWWLLKRKKKLVLISLKGFLFHAFSEISKTFWMIERWKQFITRKTSRRHNLWFFMHFFKLTPFNRKCVVAYAHEKAKISCLRMMMCTRWPRGTRPKNNIRTKCLQTHNNWQRECWMKSTQTVRRWSLRDGGDRMTK